MKFKISFLLLLLSGFSHSSPDTSLAWDAVPDSTKESIMALSEEYKSFISSHKTAHEVVNWLGNSAADARILNASETLDKGKKLKKGRGYYFRFDAGSGALLLPGKKALSDGLNLIVAHTDAPHLQLEPRPLVNERDVAVLRLRERHTSKPYQWVSRPLALHGRVMTDKGMQEVVAGEDGDFVFIIPDLAQAAFTPYTEDEGMAIMRKNSLKALAASVPTEDERLSYTVEMQVLKYFYETFGMTENDFMSADLAMVPAGPARDVGLSRLLVGGYGHDGRAGCFAVDGAAAGIGQPERWCVCLFIDQVPVMEQNGNDLLWRRLAEVLEPAVTAGGGAWSDGMLRTVLHNSRAMVAEVTNGVNPLFRDINEPGNAAYLGHGPVLMKYLGVGGKYYTNDASAEYMAGVRSICDGAGVVWQAAEFGKVDEGGGTSLSRYVAELGADVVDVALPVLSMHSPFAILSKYDLYQARNLYRAFILSE